MASFEQVLKSLKIDKEDIDGQIAKNSTEIYQLKQQLKDAEDHNESLRKYSAELSAAIRLLDGAFDSGENSGEGSGEE